jgi:hypothetical protein
MLVFGSLTMNGTGWIIDARGRFPRRHPLPRGVAGAVEPSAR